MGAVGAVVDAGGRTLERCVLGAAPSLGTRRGEDACGR